MNPNSIVIYPSQLPDFKVQAKSLVSSIAQATGKKAPSAFKTNDLCAIALGYKGHSDMIYKAKNLESGDKSRESQVGFNLLGNQEVEGRLAVLLEETFGPENANVVRRVILESIPRDLLLKVNTHPSGRQTLSIKSERDRLYEDVLEKGLFGNLDEANFLKHLLDYFRALRRKGHGVTIENLSLAVLYLPQNLSDNIDYWMRFGRTLPKDKDQELQESIETSLCEQFHQNDLKFNVKVFGEVLLDNLVFESRTGGIHIPAAYFVDLPNNHPKVTHSLKWWRKA